MAFNVCFVKNQIKIDFMFQQFLFVVVQIKSFFFCFHFCLFINNDFLLYCIFNGNFLFALSTN